MGIIDLIRKISNRTPNSDQTQNHDIDNESDNSNTNLSNINQSDDAQTSAINHAPSTLTPNTASAPLQTTSSTTPGSIAAGSSSSPPLQPSPLSIVARADASGRPIHHTSTIRRKGNKAKFNSAAHELTVEEVSPALVVPKCKPNDIILLYRDISELFSTGIKSVISGVNIMVKDNGALRRRALHENSKLDERRSVLKMQERTERANLVLWWKPFYTLWYFILECKCLLITYTQQLWNNKGRLLLFLLLLGVLATVYNIDGQHQPFVKSIEKQVLWCSYWVLLGVMSSIGLGTGLHTFVLYLGPFIAKVTLAAYECDSLNFPEPPYPNDIICPTEGADASAVSLWTIMSKVRLEAMMWGAGTALGELPPYFMARAAKLSGTEEDMDNDDIEEILEIEEKERDHPEQVKQMGIAERAKVYVHDLVHRVGFFGILACASIPNPLFDLAGITCGHFLVPFWTFFGATLIGKAIIKMHIQQLFVIFAFSEHHVEHLINLLKYIPKIGPKLREPFKEYLVKQREKLHSNAEQAPTETPWLAWVFEKIVVLMVFYFVISIINSFAQNYHKRLCRQQRESRMEAGKIK